ncbi:hypothetical protein NTGM5_690002 [Candidatus Nitrotoga sp. M5]|nr:hypothetical protein NTGM5_690002 [Candidatus Nitrotoga sp. M5]
MTNSSGYFFWVTIYLKFRRLLFFIGRFLIIKLSLITPKTSEIEKRRSIGGERRATHTNCGDISFSL